MHERERKRESQRDQKDKGKTGGTIELCVKTPGTPFLFFFNFSISINQTKRNPNPAAWMNQNLSISQHYTWIH